MKIATFTPKDCRAKIMTNITDLYDSVKDKKRKKQLDAIERRKKLDAFTEEFGNEDISSKENENEMKATWDDKEQNPQAEKSYYDGDDCYQAMRKISRPKAAAFAHFTALKYMWRLGKKEGSNPIDDLNKAKWYLDRVIEFYAEQSY